MINTKRKMFDWYFKTKLLLRILLGLLLGAIAGLVFGNEIAWVSPFGDFFVRLLKMIVMPVVIFTLVVGAASVHPSQLGRIGWESHHHLYDYLGFCCCTRSAVR